MIKKLLVVLTLFSSFLFANGSLEAKISKLQTVPKSQRYKLMNEIKRELAKMNTKQRAKALNQLRASMHSAKPHMGSGSMSKTGGGYMNNSHTKSNMQHMINKSNLHEHINKPKGPTQPSVPTKPYNPFEGGGDGHSGPKKGQHDK